MDSENFIRSRIVAIECEMQGMIAENKQREIEGHSPAYIYEHFVKLIDALVELQRH
jgi:hypothetical protein